jgi:hypothetical protein
MRFTSTTGRIAFSAAALTLLAAAGAVRAEVVTTHGSACVARGATAQAKAAVSASTSGIENRDANNATVSVICPVVRQPEIPNGSGLNVTLDGRNGFGGGLLSCSLVSFGQGGNFLGSRIFTINAGTNVHSTASLTSAQIDPFGYVAVQCLMPAFASVLGITAIDF